MRLLIALVFCFMAPVLLFGFDFRIEEEETLFVQAAEVNAIRAATINGKMSVSQTSDSMITVRVVRSCLGEDEEDAAEHLKKLTVVDSLEDGTLLLEVIQPKDKGRDYVVDFEIWAPPATFLMLDVTNGGIELEKMTGGAEVKTMNGSVSLVLTSQKIKASSINGKIDIEGHTGSIDALTKNGRIECVMSTLSGNDGVSLKTTNGSVELIVPPDISATFEVKSHQGAIMIFGFDEIEYSINQEKRKVGTIRNGDAGIVLETINGSAILTTE